MYMEFSKLYLPKGFFNRGDFLILQPNPVAMPAVVYYVLLCFIIYPARIQITKILI